MSLSSTLPDVKKQDIARDVADLRASFRTGATKQVALRRTLLLQLQQLLNDGDALLKAAMWKDLHKHPLETQGCEIAMIHSELVDHLDHLEQWSAPERVTTNLLNIPGLSYIHREPLGVACIIGTWNYPVNLLLVPMISAIAAGNCVLLRLPGDDTTRHLNNVLIALLDKYMDKNYIRYVYGGVEETKRMLQQRFDIIFATGGGFLGKIVAQAAAVHLTPVVLELGGKSPCVIDETADIALVGRRVVWGAFTNAGQTCVRPDYLLVDERVGDAVVQALEASIKRFYGEDAQASDSYGRVVNQRMFDRLSQVLEADAAHITFGGKKDAKDLFISPTLLNFKTDLNGFINSRAMKEELFGPILPIYYYKANDFDFPIQFINEREKPLSLMLFSTHKNHQKQIILQTSSGGVVLNDTMVQLSNGYLPFGGVGHSGYGSYHGRFGFNTFSHQKSVLYKYSLLDMAQRYAPYTAANERILRLLLYPISRKHIQSIKILAFLTILSVIGYVSFKK